MIKDYYSVPRWEDFDWTTVDWGDPLPNDLVALAEMLHASHMRYFEIMKDIIMGGGARDDVPGLSQWTWDYVVVKTGIADGDFDHNKYEWFSRLVLAGEYVREDRMLQLMTDDEMLHHFEQRSGVEEFVALEVDLDKIAAESEERLAKRDAEIEMLRRMMDDA